MAQARSMRSRRVALHRTTRAEDRGHGGLCAPCAKELPQASRERLVYSTRRGVLILRPRSCIEGDTMNAEMQLHAECAMTTEMDALARQLAHCDGVDCTCAAWGACECGCDADWTPAEVYKLRARVQEL